MRKIVIDSNFLNRPELDEYLSKSRENFAVLTDYSAMEAYKGDTLASIYHSMEIVSRYPKQVLILKGTQSACAMRGRQAGLQRRLIDEDQTQGFGEYCKNLKAAKGGNERLQRSLLEHGKEATAHLEKILAEVVDLPKVFKLQAESYSPKHLRLLRTNEPLSPEMIEQEIKTILELAVVLFAQHPRITGLPSSEELLNTFIFRYAIAGHLLFWRWVETGGPIEVRADRLRNDIVDLNFAVFGSFFDGLMTADKKCRGIYEELIVFLRRIFPPIDS